MSGAEPLLGWLPALAAMLALMLAGLSVAAIRQVRRATPVSPMPPASSPGSAATPVSHARAVSAASVRLAALTGRARGIDGVPLLVVAGADAAALARLVPDLDQGDGAFADAAPLGRDDCRIAAGPDGAIASFADGLLDHPRLDVRWGNFVNALLAARRNAPFDGLVFVLQAAQLTGPFRLADDALSALGERLYSLIRAAEVASGWRVPVSVVIAGAEALTGFAATAARLPERVRHAPLGWAVPYGIDTAFERRWMTEAIDAMVAKLSAVQAHLLMRPEALPTAEALLLFPESVASLAEPLGIVLTGALRQSAYHQAFMFRGVYLTGLARPDDAPPGAAPEPAFAQRLFAERIFPEHVLAQPIEGAMTRSRRRIRVAQAALAAAVLLAAAGLAEVGHRSGPVEPVGRLVADIVQLSANTAGPAVDLVPRTETLLQSMASLTIDRLETWWAPLSFVSDASADVQAAIRAAFGNVVLRAVHARLEGAIPELLHAPAPQAGEAPFTCAPGAATQADADELRQTVVRLATYADQIRNYHSLPDDPTIEKLQALLDFSLSTPLPAGFSTHYDLYVEGVRGARARPLALREMRQTVGGILSAGFGRALDGTLPGSALARAIDGAADGADAGPVPDGVARLRRLDAQLRAVQSLAPQADYAWVADPAAAGPLEGPLQTVEGLIADHATDAASLTPVPAGLAAELRRQAASCLADTRQNLRARALGGVPVLAIDHGRASLSPPLAQALGMLDAFLALPLVNTPFPAAPKAAAQGTPLYWEAPEIAALQGFAEGFAAFTDQDMQAGVPPALRERIAQAAGERLDRLTLQAEAQAQARGAAHRPVNATDTAALRDEIQRFGDATPALTGVRGALRQTGRTAAADDLDALLSGQAARLLRQVDALLTTSGPYQLADPGLSFWDGSPPLAAGAFGAETLADVIATLPARRHYVTALSRDYAAPLLAYLQQGGVPDRSNAALVTRWQAIGATLDRYDQSDPLNALTRLEQFISVDMDKFSLAQCAEVAGVAGGADWFAAQTQTIRRAIAGRCAALSYGNAVGGYGALAAAFNRDLAGRFPFGAASGPDADPGDVKRFFGRYGADLPALRGKIAAIGAYAGAGGFLDQLEAAQAALAPMLADPAPDAPLTYDIAVDFRANAGSDPGANQVAEAVLQIGPQSLSSFASSRTIAWSNGQPVRLKLRWAANAPSIPAADGAAPAQVRDGLVTFDYAGPWALLRLLADRRPAAAALAQLSDRRPEPVWISVKLHRNPDAADGGDVGLPAATLFMRLGLTATVREPGQPDKHIPVRLPDFPMAAPLPQAASLSPPVRARVR